MKSSETFYDRVTFVYPLINLFLSRGKRKFFRLINSYPSGQLLEIGIGDGSHFQYYEKHDVVGIDTSMGMLNSARKHLKNNIHVVQMNGESLLFPDESFDYVILSHVLAVVEHPEKLLEEVFRVLKPQGKVCILNHFTPDNPLQYLDNLFERFSKIFYFRSIFRLSAVKGIERFTLLSEHNAGPFSYVKFMIYEKNV